MLVGIGVSLYAQGHVAAARAIHEQLVAGAPDESRIWSNLGFILTGENELETAHQCISQALRLADTSEQEAICTANLAYLNLLAGRFDQAQEQLNRVVVTAPAEWAAIQRVAYWYDGQVIPGYSSHPNRFLPVVAAALANQVTIALALSDTAKAEILAFDLIRQVPDTSLGHEVMGWVQLALNHPDAARSSWQLALELATTQEEIAAYQSWLQQLRI
jgi:Tfp pilus assembly protein PilF